MTGDTNLNPSSATIERREKKSRQYEPPSDKMAALEELHQGLGRSEADQGCRVEGAAQS